ncbi:ATP-binding protein [Micromonospora sp. WMMC250]|nr:ATP-binding protein [Micromonospora sp. WMMC250]MCZ7379139.1 ATP-binding protein [Micromonospora sp. WMMC250]
MEVADAAGTLLRISRLTKDDESGFAILLDDRIRKLDEHSERLFYPVVDEQFQRIQRRPLANTDLLFTSLSIYGGLFSLIRRELHGSVFQLSPQQARKPGAPTPNASLQRYGENLPAVVHFLRKHRAEAWARIEDAMRVVVPNLVEIETRHTEDRFLALQFRERGVRRAWSTSEMSDGAIQALALFTAVLDGRSGFLLIEEPENSLHPWVLRRFLDLCRDESESQIVLTTHSPVAIDYTPADSLRLMWQRHGRSSYQNWTTLNPEIVEAWKRGDVRAFEAYDSGLFHEAVPPGFLAVDEDQMSSGDDGWMNKEADRS